MSDGSTPPAMPVRPRSTTGNATRNIVPLSASQPIAPPKPGPPSGAPRPLPKPAESIMSVTPGSRFSLHAGPTTKKPDSLDYSSDSASLVQRKNDANAGRFSCREPPKPPDSVLSSPSLSQVPPTPSSPSRAFSSSSVPSQITPPSGPPSIPEKPPKPVSLVVPVGSLSQSSVPAPVPAGPSPSLPSRPGLPVAFSTVAEEAPVVVGGGIGSGPETKSKSTKRRISVSMGKTFGMKISKSLQDKDKDKEKDKKKDDNDSSSPVSPRSSTPSVSVSSPVVTVVTENAKWERSAEAEAILQLLQAEKEKLMADVIPTGKTIDLSLPPPPPPLPPPERPAKPERRPMPQKPALPVKPPQASETEDSPPFPSPTSPSSSSSPTSPTPESDSEAGAPARGRVQPAAGVNARGRGGPRGRPLPARGGAAQRGSSGSLTVPGATQPATGPVSPTTGAASGPARIVGKPTGSRRVAPLLSVTPDRSSSSSSSSSSPSSSSSQGGSNSLRVSGGNTNGQKISPKRRSHSRRSQRTQFGVSVLELLEAELPWFHAMWEREPEEKRRFLLASLDSRVTQVLISHDSSTDSVSSAIVELLGPLCLNASDLLNSIAEFANYEIEQEDVYPSVQSFFQTLSDLLGTFTCNVDPLSVLSPRLEKASNVSSNSQGVPIPGSGRAQTNPVMVQAFEEIGAKLKSFIASPHTLMGHNATMVTSISKERNSAITAIINHVKEALTDDLLRISSLVSQLASVCLNAITPVNFPTTWFFIAYLNSLIEDFQNSFRLASTVHQLIIMLNERIGDPDNPSNPANAARVLEETTENIWQHNSYKAVFQNWPKGTGSVNSLVQDLTSIENHDANFLKTFITTYQSFMTPWMLFTKLMERYDVPPEKINELKPNGGAEAVKLRVCVILKYWIQNRFHDFDIQLIEKLEEFTETRLRKDGHGAMSEALLKLIRDRQLELLSEVIPINPIPDIVPQRDALQFYLFNSTEIATLAEQMTALDAEIFKNFEVTGLLNQAWEKPAYEHRSLFVRRTIRRLNRLSYWFATLILSQEKIVERAKIVSKIAQLGRAFYELRNFHACASIVVALNTAAVSRLKHTFTKISSEAAADWKVISELMEPSSSYKKYRAALDNAHNPLVPYVGVYCSDLIYINEGNPDKIGELINMNKHGLVYNVIGTILLYQQECFNIRPKEPFRTVFTDFAVADEKYLYDISLVREPRNSKITDIE